LNPRCVVWNNFVGYLFWFSYKEHHSSFNACDIRRYVWHL